MTTSEISLLDTNVLVYAADVTSPFHQDSRDLRDRGIKGEISLCVFPQIFYEFFAIVTDPGQSAESQVPTNPQSIPASRRNRPDSYGLNGDLPA